MDTRTPETAGARRKGRLAQAAWLALALPTLALFAGGLTIHYRQLQTICLAPPCYSSPTARAARALAAAGVLLSAAAAYAVALEVISVAVFTAVAATIVWRRPADRMAWFTALALLTFPTFGVQGADKVLGVLAGLDPLWRVPIYLLVFVGNASFSLLFFLFPDGRFVPRWLRVPAGAWIAWAGASVIFWAGSALDPEQWSLPARALFWAGFFAGCLYAQVYRYRHVSNYVQRQQTKWVVFGVGLTTSGAITAYTLTGLAPALGQPWALLALAQDSSYYPFMLLLPLSIGVAILRSRLYDIDVVIRRTLLYAVVTGLLAVVYLGCVLVLGTVLRTLTGQGQNQVVIVISTLSIAALFMPLRRGVQAVIDRRFDRSRYDAARALAEFAASARDETNLERVSERLVGVVDQAMRPASVSLWLRSRR